MDSARPKAARPILIADHLWRLFEDMAQSMGSAPEALINQAMFMFARANGFDPSRARPPASARSEEMYASSPADPTTFDAPPPADLAELSRSGAAPGVPLTTEPIALMPEQVVSPSAVDAHAWTAERAPALGGEEDGTHRQVAERVLQTAAQLERMLGSAPGAEPGALAAQENGVSLQADEGAGALYILSDDGQESRVAKDRYLIGRGKHCDYVISSGKVSREHAIIVREGSEYFIEDLASSNGTWFDKQRIKRRKVADGDEYFICSDRIRCQIR